MRKLHLALLGAALMVCGASLAQEAVPSTGGQLIGGVVDALGLRKTQPAPPDFVRDSRTDQLDYKPLAPTPEKTHKADAERLQAEGAALDRALAENRRRAARAKIPN